MQTNSNKKINSFIISQHKNTKIPWMCSCINVSIASYIITPTYVCLYCLIVRVNTTCLEDDGYAVIAFYFLYLDLYLDNHVDVIINIRFMENIHFIILLYLFHYYIDAWVRKWMIFRIYKCKLTDVNRFICKQRR